MNGEARKLKVLVVDDSAFHRQTIVRILSRHPRFEIIGEAANGGEAIKEVILKSPDLITLDLEMPGMDGFTFLRWVMFAKPTRAVVITSRESNRSVFKALELGAVDFMTKPGKHDSYRLIEMEAELVRKLTAAVDVDLTKITRRINMPRRKARPPVPVEDKERRTRVRGIVVASSTGGPPAIQSIIQAVPADFPVPILVNQHMPPGFTGLFARRLAGLSALKVVEAEDGESLIPGVFIAPGGHNMILEERGGGTVIRVMPSLPEDRYSPSADKLILSAAEVLGRTALGVVLTGMGDDGIIGLTALRSAGGKVIAEAESTCVVYGMPRAAIEHGLADMVLPLNEIPDTLVAIGERGF